MAVNFIQPENGTIDIPDELMPLVNKLGMQLRFHTISGKSEAVTLCHMAQIAQEFFKPTPKDISALVEKEAVGFAEWYCINKYILVGGGLAPCGYTTEQLYQKYQEENK